MSAGEFCDTFQFSVDVVIQVRDGSARQKVLEKRAGTSLPETFLAVHTCIADYVLYQYVQDFPEHWCRFRIDIAKKVQL